MPSYHDECLFYTYGNRAFRVRFLSHQACANVKKVYWLSYNYNFIFWVQLFWISSQITVIDVFTTATLVSSRALARQHLLKGCSTTVFCWMLAGTFGQNNVCCLTDSPAWCMNLSHQALTALNFVASIPRFLAISPAFHCIVGVW